MYSVYSWFGFNMETNALYNTIKRAGFDATTLWWGDKNYPDYKKHYEIASKTGLFVENAHLPYEGINNLWLDNIDGTQLVENLLQWINECADVSIPTVVMHLTTGDTPPPYNTPGLDRLKRIIETAEKRNINVALENLRRVEYLAFALENITSPRCGFCFDSGHQHLHSPNVDLLAKHGARLMALHLHDNDQTGDRHLLPFDGTINWDATMQNIKATEYTGALALEVNGANYPSAEAFLAEAFDRVKRLHTIR
ncbi:MAG: sugar phosphate isomerase/epimerase [Defluviitaleaceae bacterium]|nr:sugar phosphate isomerase/epimerase [Defluviitaleaceae bacterium]MCL2273751.1 sugar phosphate isomerase/epimerase [Defluviitaleaceae bacterium]